MKRRDFITLLGGQGHAKIPQRSEPDLMLANRLCCRYP
jgi:hypothetical protein